jgi:phage-related minor tail protein
MIASLQAACAGPFAIVITVAIAGLAYGISQIRNLHKQLDEERTKYEQSITPKITKPGDTFAVPKAAEVGIGPRGQMSPELVKKLQIIGSEEKSQEEAKKAQKKASDDAPKPIGKAGGKGGKGAKETTDNLLAPMLAMYKAKREAELADAQNSLDLLKTTNDKKKSELENSLSEGLIDGNAYYQGLQDLQQAETDGALAMIERKKQAQQKAYQESLTEVGADPKLSDEAKSIARQKLEADNRKSLAKLDTEAAQARLDGEKKIVDELKRQVEVRKQYAQKTEDLNLETSQLLGAISEQEAKLQRLLLDWQRTRQEAIDKGGYTPAYATALDANLKAKQFDASPLGQRLQAAGQVFTSAFSDLANTLFQGGVTISVALDTFGKKLMTDTFKMLFEDLSKAITLGIKDMAASIGNGMQSSAGSGGGLGGFFSGIGKWIGGLFGGASTTPTGSLEAHGGAYYQGVRQAFASGGIVTRPTLFAMATGMGLMGEAGPEGILPLTRIGGNLGVQALFPQQSQPPIKIVINNNAKNTDVSSEQTPAGDIVFEIDTLAAKAFARRGALHKLITQGSGVTRR